MREMREVSRVPQKDQRAYLSQPAREKTPVGKIAGRNSHSFDGSTVMHKIIRDDEGQWWLACAPTKPANYNYMGFREAISCPRCKARKFGTDGSGEPNPETSRPPKSQDPA